MMSTSAAPQSAGRAASASANGKAGASQDVADSKSSFASVLSETTDADAQGQPNTVASKATNAATSSAGASAATHVAGLANVTTEAAGETQGESDASESSTDPFQAIAVAAPAATVTATTKIAIGADAAATLPGENTATPDSADSAEPRATPLIGAEAGAAAASATSANTGSARVASAAPGGAPANAGAVASALAQPVQDGADAATDPMLSGDAGGADGLTPAAADHGKPAKAAATTSTTSPASATGAGTATQAVASAATQADAALDPATTSQGKATATLDAATAATATTTSSHEAGRSSATNTAAQTAAPAATVQVYTRMIERFDGRAQRFEVRLDPAELGRVDVRIEVGADKKVHAVLAAHDSAALNDLMRGQRALERALADAGIDLADGGVKFELANDSNRNASTGENNGRSPASQNVWRSFDAETPDLGASTNTITQPWRMSRLDLVA